MKNHLGKIALLVCCSVGTMTLISACCTTGSTERDAYIKACIERERFAVKLELAEKAAKKESEAKDKEITELKAEIQQLKKEDQNKVSIQDIFEVYNMCSRDSNNTALQKRYMELIILPENPTTEQVAVYLEKLSRINDSYNLNSLLKQKFMMIGRKNLEMLLQQNSYNQAMKEAAEQLLTAEDKILLVRLLKNQNSSNMVFDIFYNLADSSDTDTILAMLTHKHHMIRLVKKLGLQKKALPVILKYLEEKDLFNINYRNDWLLTALTALPEREKNAFCEKIFFKLKNENGNNSFNHNPNIWNIYQDLLILARHGYLPALKLIMDHAPAVLNGWHRISGEILPLTGMSTVKVLQEWYQKNKDHLVWDAAKKIYTAPDTENKK